MDSHPTRHPPSSATPGPNAAPRELSRIGEYAVRRRIGAGGMGVVYQAVHPVIGKRVAIKVLRPELAREPYLASRLLSEARAVNAIGHRGIVDIFGFGRLEDGRHYLVMEMLDGSSLDQLLDERGALPFAEVATQLDQVLGALDAAHVAGFVHRDLKPSNVFLVTPASGDPYVKLLDFGLAYAFKRSPDSLAAGTPRYMAPEQLRGEAATPSSDLWALGVMAIELLCGLPPFDGDTFPEVISSQRRPPHRPPPAEIPKTMVAILARLLEPDPAKRFQSAREVREQLRAAVAAPARASVAAAPLAPRPEASGGPAPSAALARSLAEGDRTIELSLEDLEPIPASAESPVHLERLQWVVEQVLDHLHQRPSPPPLPAVTLQLVELIRGEDADWGALARIVDTDPALTEQVLRGANSVLFSGGIQVKTVRDAVTCLGLGELAEIASVAAALAPYAQDRGQGTETFQRAQQRTWHQALTSAFGGTWLSIEHRMGNADRVFLGGLLHDIGKTVALTALSEPELRKKLGFDPVLILDQLLEAMHLELGARIAEEWKLPPWLVRICREHHEPRGEAKPVPKELHVVRVVSAMAEMRIHPRWAARRVDDVQESAAALGLDRFQVRAASSQIGQLVGKAEAMLKAIAR